MVNDEESKLVISKDQSSIYLEANYYENMSSKSYTSYYAEKSIDDKNEKIADLLVQHRFEEAEKVIEVRDEKIAKKKSSSLLKATKANIPFKSYKPIKSMFAAAPNQQSRAI